MINLRPRFKTGGLKTNARTPGKRTTDQTCEPQSDMAYQILKRYMAYLLFL